MPDLASALARLAAWAEPRLRANPELLAVVADIARVVASWDEPIPVAVAVPEPELAPPAEPVVVSPLPPPPVPISELPPLRFHLDPPLPTPAPTYPEERELALVSPPV